MTRKNLYYGALVLAAAATVTLAVSLTLSLSRSHQKSSPAASAPALAQVTTSTASESKGGQKEGIKVHGHWTIDVRNPNGMLVSHNEFENALTPAAGHILSRFLGRQATVGEWEIELESNGGNGPPCTTNGFVSTSCKILEPTSLYPPNPTEFFKTLTVSVPTSGTNANALVLAGTVTATRDGTVLSVSTALLQCASTIPASNCTGSLALGGRMTEKDLGLPGISVSNGQIIQVTVVISFS